MSIEPTNDQNFVSPDTDDLDAFTSLLEGKSKAPAEDDETEITNVEVKPDADDENSTVNTPTDDEAPGEDDDSEESNEDKPKKKINRYQERINELTAKAREAERALVALQVAQEQKQSETPKPPTPVVQDNAPDPDARNEDGSDKYPLGEFDPQYIRDMARHTIDREWAVKKEQEAREAAQHQETAAREALQAQWVEKLSPITEQHEDFIDKTMGLESAFDGLDPAYSDYLVTTIKSLDHGPEVLYYFANNLEEAKQFVQSGPLAATLALGEINAMFKGNTRKVEPKVSKAPPPPQVNKGSKTRSAVNLDTDDLEAFSDIFFVKKGR